MRKDTNEVQILNKDKLKKKYIKEKEGDIFIDY